MSVVYKKETFSGNEGTIIPAIWDEKTGNLVFANNGVSEKFFGASPEVFDQYNRNDFIHYADANSPAPRPFFVRIPDGAIKDDSEFWDIWELYYVYSKKGDDGRFKKKDVMYTCLTPCKPGTRFCKCDECGEKFILTPSVSRFYEERDLKVPEVRCPKCIQKRKVARRKTG